MTLESKKLRNDITKKRQMLVKTEEEMQLVEQVCWCNWSNFNSLKFKALLVRVHYSATATFSA